jgi:DNA repair protein RadC
MPDTKKHDTPHYHGHRERLRARFAEGGRQALADYELLELLLFRSIPRRDTKQLAKDLIARFGSLADVLTAPSAQLCEMSGIKQATANDLALVRAAAEALAHGSVAHKEVLSSWSDVVGYCRAVMAYDAVKPFGSCFSTRKTACCAMKCCNQAPSITRPSIPARSSNVHWSSEHPRSSSSTIIPRAIQRPRKPTLR